ncbi:hypothetical protein Q6D67_13065 [Haliea sp. E1-2-M8]|uniref:hypothetical protein n=1 Tax=Haliea sp. E1-2-M8 TaxID=3064706 RepID=UPI002722FC69|nr:hypothetical protein [Haliea sp. E1-2-M8]MDO8862634.1 hypothetical protein [Haliea sp. E1-2-M8]
MHRLIETIDQRLVALLSQLAAGLDAPPGHRLRLEGLMEAAVLLEIASAAELRALLEGRYREAFGRSLEDDLGEDWLAFFPFPQIPAMARRAPVFPSTRDDL